MRRFFQYVLFLLLCSSTIGATRGNITPTHGHNVWDVAAGFPGGYVYSISQTADGYIWIGTSKGLVRYDGLTFGSIPGGEFSSDAKPPVLALFTDLNDQLWATDDHTHLFKYEAGRLMGPLPDNGRHQYLTALLRRTREGWLLFASELQGVVEYEHGSARTLLDPSRMPASPTALAQTADGTIWIGTGGEGLFRLTLSGTRPEIQHLAAPTNVKVNCLLPIGDSSLLIGTDKGLLNLHHGNLTKANPDLSGTEILALANGQEGDIWIGGPGGVFRAQARDIDGEGRIGALDHLKVHGTVTALFEDRDGDLWIGGPEVVERYRSSGFTTYSSSTGLPCINCGAIYVDRRDRIWFAPWDGGLFLLSQGAIQAIETEGLKDDTVYSIAGGADDEVWVARKYGGLTRLHLQGDAVRAATYTQKNGLAQDSAYSVYRAPDGTIWTGTLGGGVSRFRDDAWHTFTTRDGLPSNTISAITGNPAGEIFVGTPNGLAVLTNNHWVAYTAEQGLPPGAVEKLFLDGAGTLWIGTSKGISFFQSGAVHVPLGAPNALYGEILGIAEIKGWLWITTRDHVVRVKRSALLNQSFAGGDYREFGVTEGLPSTEGVKRSRSVVVDNHGRIWFSLNKGISVLEPSAFARPAFPVAIRLDAMLVDERAISSGSSLVRVPAGRHRLTFRYVGVNVSNPDAVTYRYRLDNVDPTWSDPTTLREIDYTNTPPGRFQFHVMARNPDGVWSSQETTIAFEVAPAYYQTWWFRLSCVAAFLALLWAVYQQRKQAEADRIKRLEEIAHLNRVASMGQMAASLAHELGQPLAAILSNAQAAARFASQPEPDLQEIRGALADIAEDHQRARAFLQNMRTMFQKQAIAHTQVNLNTIVDDVSRLVRNEAVRRGVQIRIVPFREAIVVVGDTTALQQVILNLVNNGMDAMQQLPSESRILTLTTEVQKGSNYGTLLVEDNGCGIGELNRRKLFTPFFTTKPDGLGMGLSICRSLIKSFGGRITLLDRSGPGTSFQVDLPLAERQSLVTSA